MPVPPLAQIPVVRRWVYNPGHCFNKAEQHVLKPYFDSDPFFNRTWDIYHYETSNKDFFLVPCSQVLAFFDEVSRETGLTKNLQSLSPRHIQFRIDPETPYELPVLIGTSTCKADYDKLVNEHGWSNENRPVKEKKNLKKNKQKKQKKRKHLAEQSWRAQVGCARRYLGLGQHVHIEPGEPPLEIGKDGPPVIFLAVDVEAYEKDQNCITEIGVSTLDTTDIGVQAPDFKPSSDPKEPQTYGDYIISLIKSRHLRILEHRSLRNGMFVTDAADRFEFGTSEFVPLQDIPKAIADCFRILDQDGNRRKVVLVGHDIRQDMSYLRKVGYDVWNNKDLEVLDTAQMFKAVSEDPENRSLGRVLSHFEVIYWNLHNAGNDAAYTLHAFVKMAEAGVTKVDMWVGPTVRPDYEDLVEQGCIKYIDPVVNTIAAYVDPEPPKKVTPRSGLVSNGWDSEEDDEIAKGIADKIRLEEQQDRAQRMPATGW